MTTYSIAGSTTLDGMFAGADAMIAKDGQHAVQLKAPYDQNRVQSTNVPIQMVVSHTGSGTATDVNVQVSTTADFTSPIRDLTLTNLPDGYVGTTVTGLLDLTTYYWRARAARAGTGEWQAWTAPLSFKVDTATGRTFHMSHVNVGITTVSDPDSVHWADWNIGLIYSPVGLGVGYVNENLGLIFAPDPDAVQWSHWGDVSTNTPTPHLWFLQPAAGRPGDGIRIFCLGVGDLVETFGGVVEIDYGVSRGWVPAQVVAWQTFPPGINAYTELRTLDPAQEIIDMQHTVVEITIPDDVIPPGYPIRIRTEGP